MLAHGLNQPIGINQHRFHGHAPAAPGQLGMCLREDPRGGWHISDVLAGGCADIAGVKNFDRLVMIDELSLAEDRLDLESVKQLLSTTWVKLTLMRQGRQVHVMLQRQENIQPPPRSGRRSSNPAEQGQMLARLHQNQAAASSMPYYAANSQTWQQQASGDPRAHVMQQQQQQQQQQQRQQFELPVQPAVRRPDSERPSSGGYGDAEFLEAEMERVRLVEDGKEARAAYTQQKPAAYNMPNATTRIPAQLSPPEKTSLPPNGGVLGLINLGNTCFLNSIVQCLAHVMPFVSHVIFDLDDELQQLMKVEEQEALAAAGSSGGKQTGGIKDVNAPGERLRVVRALIALMRHLWSGEHQRPLEPRTLLSALKSDKRCSMLFNGKQQDAHECLLILLDIIHMDTNGMIQSNPAQKAASKALASPALGQATTPADDEWSVVDKDEAGEGSSSQGCEDDNADVVDMDSVVSTYMRGILRCETKCKACSYATHNTDKFFVATLPLPPRRQFPSLTPISLEECFALSEKSESINTWTCDKCKRLDATNSSLVVSHPRILILHLARFEYVAGANARRKRGDEILIPAKISRPGASGQPAQRFELFAWSEHLGNDDSSGHYVAIARHTDGGFRRYDDGRVTDLPPLPAIMKNSSAYILFYERKG